MSFGFKWPEFSRQFHADAAAMLDSALNRGPKPKVIADDIKVEDIHMGSIPPELDMLEIGELSSDRFRGIFRLTYAGNAHLLLSTKVQANPLTRPTADGSSSQFEDVSSAFPTSMPSRGILFAARPLVVPMKLRLSQMRLKAIVVLVVSKQKGITLVFKNDPLESVDVSSTFDSVAVIQKYLQEEIEGQLREMFREDLPGIIHRLSQRWLSSHSSDARKNPTMRSGNKASADRAPSPVDAATTSSALPIEKRERTTSTGGSRARRESESKAPSSIARSPSRRRKSEKNNALTPSSPRLSNHPGCTPSAPRTPSKKMAAASSAEMKQGEKSSAEKVSQSPQKQLEEPEESFSFSSSTGSAGGFGSSFALDVARYDPTYGLRPDEVRMSASGSKYSGLAKLAGRAVRGLGELMISEEPKKEPEPVNATTTNEDLPPFDSNQSKGLTDEALLTEFKDTELDDTEDIAGEMSESDDVPDLPSSDEEDSDVSGDEGEEVLPDDDLLEIDAAQSDDEVADNSRYGYPPVGSDFFDNAVEASARGSASLFAPSVADSHRGGRRSIQSRLRSPSSPARSSAARDARNPVIQYETIPAVGGGTVTRPRIYHIASTVQAPDVEVDDDLAASHGGGSVVASSTARGPPSSRTYTARWRGTDDDDFRTPDLALHESDDVFDQSTSESPSAIGHDSLATLEPEPMDPLSGAYKAHVYRHQAGGLYRPGYDRHSSISPTDHSSGTSTNTGVLRGTYGGSASGPSTAPTSSYPSTRVASQTKKSPSGAESAQKSDGLAVTRQSPGTSPSKPRTATSGYKPAMTTDASNHFMDLVNTNHTLSPFTRTLETKGFAVRSHPVTPGGGQSVASGPSSGSFNPQSRGPHAFQSRTAPPTPSEGIPRIGYPRGSGSVASATSSGSAAAGRRRVFRLGTSAESTKLGHDADTPVSPALAGSSDHEHRTEVPRVLGRSSSTASLDQIHGSAASSSGAPSSRSSNASGARYRSGMAPLTSSPLVSGSNLQFSQKQQPHSKRPPLDPTRRRSAAYFGEEYVARTMGSIRE